MPRAQPFNTGQDTLTQRRAMREAAMAQRGQFLKSAPQGGGGGDSLSNTKSRVDVSRSRGVYDDDSDTSSVGHDPTTAEPVFSSPHQRLRYEMKQQAKQDQAQAAVQQQLARTRSGHRGYSVGGASEHGLTQRSGASDADPGLVHVPYRRTDDSGTRRLRSSDALRAARDAVAESTGAPPRMVQDPDTGLLLPRDAVVAPGRAERVAADDAGQGTVLLPPPAVGATLHDPRHQELARRQALGETTRVHYQSSMEVLEALRQQRLLRSMGMDL